MTRNFGISYGLFVAVCMAFFTLYPASTYAQMVSDGSVPDSGAQDVSGVSQPPPKPEVIYVTDFFLDPTGIDKEKILQRERSGGRRRSRHQDEDPIAKAKKLVTALSQSIIDGLNNAGQKAVHLPSVESNIKGFPPDGVVLPKQGWLVGGWFVKVDEGNRALEATVGFGAGSGQVEIEVVASDLSGNPADPFLFLGSETKSKVRPGGLVRMNPYAMAAKFVLAKGATEKDVKEQGLSIASKLQIYISTGAADSK